MKHIFLFLIIVFLNTFASASGVTIGNGGDRRALEFVDIAMNVLGVLRNNPLPQVDLERLNKAVMQEAQVESTDEELFLNGMPKDAINYPQEKRIVFNRTAWDRRTSYFERAAFCFA